MADIKSNTYKKHLEERASKAVKYGGKKADNPKKGDKPQKGALPN